MKDFVEDFKSYWPKLMTNIRSDKTYDDIHQSINWLDRLMNENVPHGKHIRGLIFLQIYRDLVPIRTAEENELSYIIAWCIEIMQTAYLIADDIMDSSETRRGMPCWYRLPEVGSMAVNDSILLENLVYELISKCFENKILTMELTQMFLKTSYKTILGQSFDTRLSHDRTFDKFTIDTYSTIVKYKSSYYTFYQPSALALILARMTEDYHLKPIEELSLQLGQLFQVQDDYIDCYADPEVSGKIGTDIIDGKCTWLAVTALSLANKEQRMLLEEYYGVNDKSSEILIKSLYSELNIPQVFLEYQKLTYNNIQDTIQKLDPKIPKDPFIQILNTIYKREK